jgi:hypothetical protein
MACLGEDENTREVIEGDKRGFYKLYRKANKWSLIPYEGSAMWLFA